MRVPAEAKIIWGTTYFPSKIVSMHGDQEAMMSWVAHDIERIKFAHDDAEIIFNKPGPYKVSWQVRYFDSYGAKELEQISFDTYLNIGNVIFKFGNLTSAEQSLKQTAETEHIRTTRFNTRDDNHIPEEQGFCIEDGFIQNSSYNEQEIINAGIYLPSLPDITFSVSSNKDAYLDYPKVEFDAMKAKSLSLLGRIRSAQERQGENYPARVLLREGKRSVQHWTGEESLIKRPDGVHDFEWAFVGSPGDVANPPEFSVAMFSKVKHNVVGAAERTSLNDAEALALWDTLLSALKFRVKVPGAPEGTFLTSSEVQAKN